MQERWLPVSGYEGIFEISDKGRFKVLPTTTVGSRYGRPMRHSRGERVLSPSLGGGRNYRRVLPQVNGVVRKFYIHRLVAEHFVPGRFDGATVNHKDGNKDNNSATNLEWITRSENTRHQWSIGLLNSRGIAHPGHKLSSEAVAAIRASTSPLKVEAKKHGVSESLISSIRLGKARRAG